MKKTLPELLPDILRLMKNPAFIFEVENSGYDFDSGTILKSLYDLLGLEMPKNIKRTWIQ